LTSNGLLDMVREVKGPLPVMSRDAEQAVTQRQRELLDQLDAIFADGFAHLTMAEIASSLSCSLRTLYGLAPSRDDLVVLVVDRGLWAVGRAAMSAIGPTMAPLDAIRSYLRAANVAVATTTETFAADAAANPRTRALNTAHSQYLIDITRALLDAAVNTGDIDPIDSAAVARVMAGLGADFAGPDVLPTLATSPKDAADAVVDIVLAGLTRRTVTCR
jgi:AcrR family transcriptional regulator